MIKPDLGPWAVESKTKAEGESQSVVRSGRADEVRGHRDYGDAAPGHSGG